MSRPIADIATDMKKVIAELATIVDYVNGSISERPRKYRKADGSESEQKALPTLQYYADGKQGGKRIPRKMLPSVRRRVENGKRRKALLMRLDALAAEKTLAEIESGVQKKTTPRSAPTSSTRSGPRSKRPLPKRRT